MLDLGETFFTAAGCMDGRVQDAVAQFGKAKFGVMFADTITEAGLVGKLASSNVDQALLDSLKFKIAGVSVGKHNSKGIIVHGHQNCAGNPVDDSTHKEHVLKAAGIIRSFVPNLQVIPVFVVHAQGKWQATVIEQ